MKQGFMFVALCLGDRHDKTIFDYILEAVKIKNKTVRAEGHTRIMSSKIILRTLRVPHPRISKTTLECTGDKQFNLQFNYSFCDRHRKDEVDYNIKVELEIYNDWYIKVDSIQMWNNLEENDYSGDDYEIDDYDRCDHWCQTGEFLP